jgi:hypothetical protein
MKKQLLIFIIFGPIIIILSGWFMLKHLKGEKTIDETKTVFIKKTDKGFQLYRNGNAFYIRGASGNSHFRDLSLIGGNTIRLYDTLHLASFLDEAQKCGLAVIVDIPIPEYQTGAYLNEEFNSRLKQEIKDLVKKHRAHPALLMWNLGNEVGYPMVFRKNRFIDTFNDLIDLIHTNDPDHPVGTAIFNNYNLLAIYLHSPQLDVVSCNVFGSLIKLKSFISKLNYFINPIPYYISEWGTNGPWEVEMTNWGAPIEPTSTKKGEQCRGKFITLITPNSQCLGSLIFYWGQKQEKTPTWFSIFDDQGRKTQTYYDLQRAWKNQSINTYLPPQIRYMLVDKKGASDQLVFTPNEIKNAQIFLATDYDSTLQFNWEIYEEDWVEGIGKKINKISDCFESIENTKATFRSPAIEGPYRIFAYVYDQHGYVASVNTPFYVMDKQ